MGWNITAKSYISSSEWIQFYSKKSNQELILVIIHSEGGIILSKIKTLGLRKGYSDTSLSCQINLPSFGGFTSSFYVKRMQLPIFWLVPATALKALNTDLSGATETRVDSAPLNIEPPDCSYQGSYDRLVNEPSFQSLLRKLGGMPFAKTAPLNNGKIVQMVKREMDECKASSFSRP